MCQYCSHDDYMAAKAESDSKKPVKKKTRRRKKNGN